MTRIALFPGSFDPFTRGHQNIVERGLKLFDEVVIAIGKNTDKKFALASEEDRRDAIADFFKDNPRVKVVIYDKMTVDYAKEIGSEFILRGVRSLVDYEYELTIADINFRLSGIETVLLLSDPSLTAISSTLVRELISYGKDVSDFLPKKE